MEEARRFMNLIATASDNRVLAILVEALHRMSGETSAGWDEKQRRSELRSYERVVQAIENGESEEARRVMAKSLAAALRSWADGSRRVQAAGRLDRFRSLARNHSTDFVRFLLL